MIMNKETNIIFECINKTKAEDVVLYDVEGKSPLCDAIIVCTALNERNLNGLKEQIEECCLENNIKINHIEGRNGSQWIVMDLNDTIVHILTREERIRLNLDDIIETK